MAELYASVDLGGTNVKCALAGADGEIVAEKKTPTGSHDGPEGVLERVAAAVRELAEQADAEPAALGMGVPGLIDLERGVTKFVPNLPTQWRDVPVRDLLSPKLGCDVYLLNDVRTATLGELTFGHGRGRSGLTMIFLALGTGVGGGVVVDGKLRLGASGSAGELGHQTILPDGAPCGCGNRGCLETLASGPAIAGEGVRLLRSGLAPKLHDIVGGDPGKVDPKTMQRAIEAGDERVREAVVRAAEYLGIGVANMVVALEPEIIVIGGGVAKFGDVLFDAVRETLRRRVGMLPTDEIEVLPSALGDKAGAMGGIALAMKGGKVGA